MKRYFRIIPLSIALTLFVQLSIAQSNLQFNEAKFLTYETPVANATSPPYPTLSFTVPQGKVWKIESVGGAAKTNAIATLNRGVRITLNGSEIYRDDPGGTFPYNSPSFPIWLPEGTYTLVSTRQGYVSSTSPYYLTFYVSAIEFNLCASEIECN